MDLDPQGNATTDGHRCRQFEKSVYDVLLNDTPMVTRGADRFNNLFVPATLDLRALSKNSLRHF